MTRKNTTDQKKYRESIVVSVVNFHTTWGDKKANLDKIKECTKKAVKRGAELILFPECALTGYDLDPEHRLHKKLAEPIPGPSTEEMAEIASKHGIYVVFGMPEQDRRQRSRVYNSAAFVGPRGVMGSYRKVHLWQSETSWCERGNGYPVFETDYGPVAIGICYDNYHFPEVARTYALKGVRLLLNPTAMPNTPGGKLFDCMVNQVKAISIENLFFVASANLVGSEISSDYVGGSLITGPNYPAVTNVYAGPASSTREEILTAKLDFRKMDKIREKVTVFSDRRPDTYGEITETSFAKPRASRRV